MSDFDDEAALYSELELLQNQPLSEQAAGFIELEKRLHAKLENADNLNNQA